MWYIENSEDIGRILAYFDFNDIEYIPFLDQDIVSIVDKTKTNKIVMSYHMFSNLLHQENKQNQLIELMHSNYVWVWSRFDAIINIQLLSSILLKIDSQIPKNHLFLFSDAEFVGPHWTNNLKNIIIKHMPCSAESFYVPRIRNGRIKKTPSHDFLITAINKPSNPARAWLVDRIRSRPALADKGIISFNTELTKQSNWLGHQTNIHDWQDGHPSMDLYNNAWIEVVPETFSENILFVTEKIMKPIATKTPFVVLAAPGYLQYLRDFGFITFDQWIDESYDLEPNLDIRVNMIVDALEKVVTNGSENFYNQASSVLDHNYKKLAELTGSFTNRFEFFIRDCLDDLDNLMQ